jgi:hypothetical protein
MISLLLPDLTTLCFYIYRAGDTLAPVGGVSFLPAPPVSIMLDQQLIETSSATSDGEKKKISYLEQSLFAIGCCMDDGPTLVPLDISVKLDSPSAGKYWNRTMFMNLLTV